MQRDISEADWRVFKKVHQALQERFCQRTLDTLAKMSASTGGDVFDRYSQVQQFLRRCDKDYAQAFNDFRRSTAVMQLIVMRRMGLLTDGDLEDFSEATQDIIRRVEAFEDAYRGDSSRSGRG